MLLDLFREMEQLTQRLVGAARAADWSQVDRLLEERQQIMDRIERLKPPENEMFSAEMRRLVQSCIDGNLLVEALAEQHGRMIEADLSKTRKSSIALRAYSQALLPEDGSPGDLV